MAVRTPTDNPDKKLTEMQERFVDFYLMHMNGTKAAKQAGYSIKRAPALARHMLASAHIKKAIKMRREKRAKETKLDANWVLYELRDLYEKCIQAVPVTDREGNHLGEYKMESQVAKGCLELIGRHNAMFTDNIAHHKDVQNMSDEELSELINELAGKLGFTSEGAEGATKTH